MSTATATQTATWAIDNAHSEISFKVKHLMITNVTGYFREFGGHITPSEQGWEGASVEFFAKTASVDTNQKDRDAHLQSDDFFNAAQFPELRFVSTSFENAGGNQYKMNGNLTIRDITKTVTLNVESLGEVQDPYGNTKSGFEISGTINRQDFGLRWSAVTEAGGIVVSDEVRLQLNVQGGFAFGSLAIGFSAFAV
ncbi:MAG: YceI family protein [Saprospiraceae bacterium]|nr:YceI family protein [Saprospiraceae bacterium]